MKILIVSLAVVLLTGVVYYFIAKSNSTSTEQSTHLAQPVLAKNRIFTPPSTSNPGYMAAKKIMTEKLLKLESPAKNRLLVTDRTLVAELFQASNAIVKGQFGLGKRFDVTLFDDQPCSFDSLLHPMTTAGTFQVLMAQCQERSEKNSVRMILSPQNNQLYVSISEKGHPQAKSIHLAGDYVVALDEVKNQIELLN